MKLGKLRKPRNAAGKRPFLVDALAAALFLGGCLTNQSAREPEELNGESSLLAQEVGDMGDVSVAAALLKRSAAKTAAESADVALTPLKYDAGCQCHIRSISITTAAGYSRQRVDSVFFRDAEDKSLRFPTPARLKSITHKRWVRQGGNGREAEMRIVTGMLLSIANGDTVGTWNGDIGGSYAGLAYHEGKITDVVRKLKAKRWEFPQSGSVQVKSAHATLTLTFQGDGTAKAVRGGDLTGKTTTVVIDSEYREKI
jgi:hypothetical protein